MGAFVGPNLLGPGVDVDVVMRVQTGTDAFANPTYEDVPAKVHGVLVAPGSTSDLDATRPEGVRVAYTLHFPKAFTGLLDGARVKVPRPDGGVDECRVIGSPRPYQGDLTPGPWNLPVEVEAVDG